MKYTSEVSLGNNVGNIRRIENLADIQMNQKIQQFSASLDKAKNDLEEAKSNVSKPFERAGELEEMTKRLEVVNAELSKSHVDDVDEPAYVSDRPTEEEPTIKEPEKTVESSKYNVTVTLPAMVNTERVPQMDRPPSPQLDKPKHVYNKMKR